MSYLAIYRRFRPTTFSQVIGQEHVIKTLTNQINGQRVGHAYLFCGARGTGKTSVAKIFARAINCLTPENGSPCFKCQACQSLANPTNLDILEIDAASNNGVDDIRELRESVQYPPVAGQYKVYIIDEVHMLSPGAFNALLKTLEEPPKHAVFILATTEPQKLPATILSRCMRFDFHLVADEVIQKLIENIYTEVGKPFESEATALIAKAGEGSVRDALSLADLCLSDTNEKLTYKQVIDLLGASDRNKTAKLCEYILKSDVGNVMGQINEITSFGKSVSVLSKDVCQLIRDVLVAKTCKDAKAVLKMPDDEVELLKQLASLTDSNRLLRILEIFAGIETELRYSTHPRVVLESAAVKATLPSEDYNVDALISRVTALERQLKELSSGAVPISVTPQKQIVTIKEDPEEDKKSAYKPVIDHIEPISEPKKIEKPTKKEEQFEAVEGVEPKAQPTRLKAFDYISDEDAPMEEEPFIPTDDQIGFDMGFGAQEPIAPVKEPEKAQPMAQPKVEVPTPQPMSGNVIRDRLPDSRIWGAVLKSLRANSQIMLWIACQELDTKIEDQTLTILVDGDNEYNLLKKPESMEILQSTLQRHAPYKLVLKRVGAVETEDDKFQRDAAEVNKRFGNKLEIK